MNAAEWVPFTPVFNVTGQPAISLPLHQTPDGLPIGVQLVGPPAGEPLLAVGAARAGCPVEGPPRAAAEPSS